MYTRVEVELQPVLCASGAWMARGWSLNGKCKGKTRWTIRIVSLKIYTGDEWLIYAGISYTQDIWATRIPLFLFVALPLVTGFHAAIRIQHNRERPIFPVAAQCVNFSPDSASYHHFSFVVRGLRVRIHLPCHRENLLFHCGYPYTFTAPAGEPPRKFL